MKISRRLFLGGAAALAVATPVLATAIATPPAQDWLPCDGREVPIQRYPELYSAIGGIYGRSVNRNTFNLPDLRAPYDVTLGGNQRRMEHRIKTSNGPVGVAGMVLLFVTEVDGGTVI